ncbi:MAG: hypothetical protein IPG28_01725 [Betaproteobacteria bacterium]|nr:hypothetical protein [Betaproteobacteria bacterium]
MPGTPRGAADRIAGARDRRPPARLGRAGRAVGAGALPRGIHLHLDGARLWEAREAYAPRTHAEIAALFDSVYVSFYKGVGALAGAMLLGRGTSSPRRGCRPAGRGARWCSCTPSSPRRRCASTTSSPAFRRGGCAPVVRRGAGGDRRPRRRALAARGQPVPRPRPGRGRARSSRRAIASPPPRPGLAGAEHRRGRRPRLVPRRDLRRRRA